MNNIVDTLGDQLQESPLTEELQTAGQNLGRFIDPDAYVGEVFSLSYESALVQVHDL